MTYQEALDYIASLAPRGWRFGIDRMAEFARRAGLTGSLGEQGGPQFVHIAGTNGKGTVTAFVQSILVEHGYRTGAFYSPYVYDPRERIQFGREYITPEAMAELTERLIPAAESLAGTEFGEITEFEFKTALGLLYWKEMRCDWGALEVGLGGRLDSTNIVTPRVAVIASIGLDHTNVLGMTHSSIAYEKAGIIKEGVPTVLGELSPEALAVVRQIANEQRSPLWTLGRDFVVEGDAVRTPSCEFDGLHPQMAGKYVRANMAIAIACLEAAGVPLDHDAVRRGVAQAWLPGRFERRTCCDKDVVLDGAHNSDSAQALMESLRAVFPGRHLVLLTGMVQGHEPAEFYRWFERVKVSHCAPIDFYRTQSAEEVARAAPGGVPHASAVEAIQAALQDTGPYEVLVVTGSFYLVGEVGRLLEGIDEVKDVMM